MSKIVTNQILQRLLILIDLYSRQKRKKQLKALLRAKNLGPLLDSKEIAQSTGMKYYPQYVKKHLESRGHSSSTPDIGKSLHINIFYIKNIKFWKKT